MTNATYFKVSYVVEGGFHPGAIINMDKAPKTGDRIQFDGAEFIITELMELMPPNGDFGFLHATCRFIRKTQ